jgi:hypothetical protein
LFALLSFVQHSYWLFHSDIAPFLAAPTKWCENGAATIPLPRIVDCSTSLHFKLYPSHTYSDELTLGFCAKLFRSENIAMPMGAARRFFALLILVLGFSLIFLFTSLGSHPDSIDATGNSPHLVPDQNNQNHQNLLSGHVIAPKLGNETAK